MIAIYTQDGTQVYKDADDAKDKMLSLYGMKLGEEAYNAVKDGRPGDAYRKYGGPLIQVITPEKAEWIKEKENSLV